MSQRFLPTSIEIGKDEEQDYPQHNRIDDHMPAWP